MAPNSARPAKTPSVAGKRRAKATEPPAPSPGGTGTAAEPGVEDIAERAARLGITPERVLQEYARIAFADLRHFIEWGPDGLVVKSPELLSDADAAAISEIVGSGAGGYRVKLYDKKAALDAIARHLGMFVAPRRRDDEASPDPAEDAREVLARRLARLAAGSTEI